MVVAVRGRRNRLVLVAALGTGCVVLVIVVAVVLDTMKQIESRMLMRHYDGFRSRRQASGGRRWAAKERNA